MYEISVFCDFTLLNETVLLHWTTSHAYGFTCLLTKYAQIVAYWNFL